MPRADLGHPPRQQCEAKAKQKYLEAKAANVGVAQRAGWIAFGFAEAIPAATGCLAFGTAGMAEAGLPGAVAGCFNGGALGAMWALPDATVAGFATTGVTSFVENYFTDRDFKKDMQACSSL